MRERGGRGRARRCSRLPVRARGARRRSSSTKKSSDTLRGGGGAVAARKTARVNPGGRGGPMLERGEVASERMRAKRQLCFVISMPRARHTVV